MAIKKKFKGLKKILIDFFIKFVTFEEIKQTNKLYLLKTLSAEPKPFFV
jgi:hypothetical protein